MNSTSEKYTCSCCGYITLSSNDIGEICPVCFWEEDYNFGHDHLFDFSCANNITLYEAQQNYLQYSCCDTKLISHCRKPNQTEKKSADWLSIQEIIEKDFDIKLSINKISELSELLICPDAETEHQQFKLLKEIDMLLDYDKEDACEITFEDKDLSVSSLQFYLKVLTINIAKKDINLLIELFHFYYKKGLCYYVTWSIFLFTLSEYPQRKPEEQLINDLIQIEIDGFYGLDSIKKAITSFWLKNKLLNTR
jgi:hypothetical protein